MGATMVEYRAYLIGQNGHIVHRVDMLAMMMRRPRCAPNSSLTFNP